ncbi:MAG TPA: hypothetical protein P5125_07685, partial [Kiritimatiellia bacterium]|nr:hypothetical protein [Kiritimatiellia bacterium]
MKAFFVRGVLVGVLCVLSVDAEETVFVKAGKASMPLVDLSQDQTRQVVVAAGTPEVYQGHPTTVSLPDGRTIF